jgi:hypothetical protein
MLEEVRGLTNENVDANTDAGTRSPAEERARPASPPSSPSASSASSDDEDGAERDGDGEQAAGSEDVAGRPARSLSGLGRLTSAGSRGSLTYDEALQRVAEES